MKNVKPTGSTRKKVGKPIGARQVGELARLLEERGCDFEIVQRTMIENIDGLCFFLQGKFGHLVGNVIEFWQHKHGYICEVPIYNRTSLMGIARNFSDYAMGNIYRVGDRIIADHDVFYEDGFVPDQWVIIHAINIRDDVPMLDVKKEKDQSSKIYRIDFMSDKHKRGQ